jgi:hypothetical protein
MMRPLMLRMMTTVNWSYTGVPRLNLIRMSMTGIIIPRKLITPLMNSGALAMRVTAS